jgi:hypothetical protein
MLRCVFGTTLATVLAATLALPALAQATRPFPATALRGVLQIVQAPDVRLNDQAARLAPGARIRGANNMLQMSGALVGQQLLVHYTVEPTSGQLLDVWLLTPEEAARKPWPTTPQEAQQWLFNPAAQTWTRR